MIGYSFGTSGRAGGSSVFDPATLSLTGWWRGDYAGAPWTGTASAGASGSRDLSTLSSDPAVGTALNGYDSADFDGTANQLTTSLAGSSLLSASAFSFWCLINMDSVPADPGAGSRWQGYGLWGDSAVTYVQVAFTAAGASLGVTSSGAYDEVTETCSTGANHLVQATFDGNNLRIRVDSGSWQSAATTNGPNTTVDDLTNTIKIGVQIGYFDGRVWDLAFADSVISDANFDNIRSYMNSRYGVSV